MIDIIVLVQEDTTSSQSLTEPLIILMILQPDEVRVLRVRMAAYRPVMTITKVRGNICLIDLLLRS